MGVKFLFPLAVALALLAGCKATSVTLNFEAIEPVYVSPSTGQSRAVETRIYHLRSRAAFENAETGAIWEHTEDTLKGDLIKWEPGETVYPSKPGGDVRSVRNVVENLDQETRFIGVLALMDRTDGEGKRHAVVSVEEAGSVKFVFTGYRVDVIK